MTGVASGSQTRRPHAAPSAGDAGGVAARSARAFPELPDGANRLEEEILERWREEELFRRTLEATEGEDEFVFYEGPPTANGPPGIHHVLSRTIKDVVCRYQTMRGRHVTRIAGWDTHGLPVEIDAEQKLGISGKPEIDEVGVERFNRVCRDSVFTYKEDWERLSERIGYWLDYTRPYVTFSPDYIESVWAIIRRIHERGLLYRGHKSVPYCPRCGTALSSHEVAQGYEEVLDPSLHFLCPVLGEDGEPASDGRAFLAWTTTPWTLPANVALAVHPELPYVEVEHEGRRLILAEARVDAVIGEDARVLRRYAADDLVGLRYRRPFDLVPVPEDAGPAWRVVAEDFVSADDGTGIVHLAPAFGADDFEAGRRHDLPMLRPIDDEGEFDESLPLVGGLFVKAADEPLVQDLDERGLVFRHSLEPHSYPHCWRCSSPLIYMARASWYIRTTAIKDEMIANNGRIAWHPPEVGTGRFGEWLAGNVDWALSRDRYWGTPLPAWLCDEDAEHIEFIGSFTELAERAGELPVPADAEAPAAGEGGEGPDAAKGRVPPGFDPHKPWIDEVTWPCPDCGGTMRRTSEVIDVWFDSGSMPYAQWHYPFENEDAWRRHFPADFICEGVDQTRGWFYSLLAISTLLGDGPAYRNVIVNDLVLDRDGRKMSKSRGNAVDPWDAIGDFGADAVRWYFAAGSQPWLPKRFDPDALAEAARRTFDTLANTYRFFALYANLEDWAPSDDDPSPDERHVLDRWILSRLYGAIAEVDRALAGYDITRAARAISEFIVDDVSNWYVRRSRERFWGGAEDGGDAAEAERAKASAFRTLADVLVAVTRLLAPFTPFQADWLHRALTGGESAHLAPFPQAAPSRRDEALEAEMEAARALARLGRSARESVRIRVRQPLRTVYAVIPGGRAIRESVLAVVRDEINVKEIRFLDDARELIALRAEPNFAAIGPRFGARTQAVADAIRSLPEDRLRDYDGGTLAIVVEGEGVELDAGEFELREAPRGELAVETGDEITVALDPTMDEELRREGLARELVSRIQRLRRDAGLDVADRIRLGIAGSPDVVDAASRYGRYIARETLARELEIEAEDVAADRYRAVRVVDIDGVEAKIGLAAV